MKKGIFLVALVFVLVASVVIVGCAPAPKPTPTPVPAPAPAPAGPKPVELKLWSAWTPDIEMATDPFMFWFRDRINDKGKAVGLSVKYLGGPEVFPPSEGTDAVKKGLVDMGFTAAVYYIGLVPEADAIKLSRIKPWEERANGAYELMNQFHQKQINAYYLWRAALDDFFQLYLNVERTKPDLSGLKLRSTPAYDAVIKALNGVPVTIAGPETYTAVERGTVDGYGFTVTEPRSRKLETVTKYIWGPRFYGSPTVMIFNLDRWKSLHDEQRAFLTKLAQDLERESDTVWDAAAKSAIAFYLKAGMKEMKFAPADEKYFLDTAYDIGWKTVLSKAPEVAKFKALVEKK